jgi:homoserine kinase
LAAFVQQGEAPWDVRTEVLRAATEMEGHADNVAASLVGGIVAVAAGKVVRVPLAREVAVVVWIPDHETPTSSSRRLLPDHVSLDDAVFNIGRTALLVAALAAGEFDVLRAASEDRLHQDRRLSRARDSRGAIEAALHAGAWCAWLSGSGPSVAAIADPARADRVAAALPATGRSRVMAIDDEGASVT